MNAASVASAIAEPGAGARGEGLQRSIRDGMSRHTARSTPSAAVTYRIDAVEEPAPPGGPGKSPGTPP